MTSIAIPRAQRVPISRYCARHISPQRYYLHNAVGGINWCVALSTTDSSECIVEAPDEHLVIIRLKYGV